MSLVIVIDYKLLCIADSLYHQEAVIWIPQVLTVEFGNELRKLKDGLKTHMVLTTEIEITITEHVH